jgi:hypothetical protein
LGGDVVGWIVQCSQRSFDRITAQDQVTDLSTSRSHDGLQSVAKLPANQIRGDPKIARAAMGECASQKALGTKVVEKPRQAREVPVNVAFWWARQVRTWGVRLYVERVAGKRDDASELFEARVCTESIQRPFATGGGDLAGGISRSAAATQPHDTVARLSYESAQGHARDA